ncbi:hypothetical protein L21_1802 [Methanoculleus chikugoensis]|jgi:hypothetical protein|uniref:Uncharacterized protein n=1 Tax=Methanoculleus chikugoensis TaxID=118126 RepID=A0A1M4MLT9_9EURY|nr:hypothetical protein [Methanoculleus chikugoensis]MDD4566600.1 hypothetical protein [Methanoculleus chikugoensis]NMA11001.1 hypothetical protein [Methanomicrobiales archaeon]SCL75885.1 hypothetical protein L21_1802 [Methanoculleus chikugoensis]
MMESGYETFSPGEPAELEAIGLAAGMRLGLDRLKDLQERRDVEVILYFDEDLARNSTLEADYADFRIVPVQARPFMPLAVFLRVIAERDPEFSERTCREPPVVEVLETGMLNRYSGCVACRRPYVKALLL